LMQAVDSSRRIPTVKTRHSLEISYDVFYTK
jgi:hypothetical protein